MLPEVAVIVVMPEESAVTSPLLSMRATLGLPLAQKTFAGKPIVSTGVR